MTERETVQKPDVGAQANDGSTPCQDALSELLRWQPRTVAGRARLHPQHRAAIEAAESALASEASRA